jgi:hypothetical protein
MNDEMICKQSVDFIIHEAPEEANDAVMEDEDE